MGVGSGLYMFDVVVKRSRSLSHLLMSSCWKKSITVPNVVRIHFLFLPFIVPSKIFLNIVHMIICVVTTFSALHLSYTINMHIDIDWLCGTVIERRTLKLSVSHARPVAEGWPVMLVSHQLYMVSQLGQLSLSSYSIYRPRNYSDVC